MDSDLDRRSPVIVTGGAGFLGRNIVRLLEQRGFTNVFSPRSSQYDLTKFEQTSELFREIQPSYVIHAAAVVGGIGANAENPGKFFYENASMGLNVVEHCREFSVSKLLTVGTVCSYPKFTAVPFKEESLWDGYPEETNAPYGIAKKAVLTQQTSYAEQYGLNSIFVLPSNLYGPRDNFNEASSHVIPALIKKIQQAQEDAQGWISVWGTGAASREFLYVEDAADGIVSALELYNDPSPVNLGTGYEVTIHALVELIADVMEFDGEIRWDASKPDGQPRRSLDTSKAKEKFGFEAKTPLRAGLTNTIEWYRSSLSTVGGGADKSVQPRPKPSRNNTK